MAKAQLKTQKTKASVAEFLRSLPDKQQQADSRQIVKMMKAATGAPAKMWGPAIIGFGDLQMKYASGRELDWFILGFSPRKGNLSMYFMCGFDVLKPQLKLLGKHKLGKSCLYVKSLADVDVKVLEKMIKVAATAPICGCGEC
jgi:hypothetical protein